MLGGDQFTKKYNNRITKCEICGSADLRFIGILFDEEHEPEGLWKKAWFCSNGHVNKGEYLQIERTDFSLLRGIDDGTLAVAKCCCVENSCCPPDSLVVNFENFMGVSVLGNSASLLPQLNVFNRPKNCETAMLSYSMGLVPMPNAPYGPSASCCGDSFTASCWGETYTYTNVLGEVVTVPVTKCANLQFIPKAHNDLRFWKPAAYRTQIDENRRGLADSQALTSPSDPNCNPCNSDTLWPICKDGNTIYDAYYNPAVSLENSVWTVGTDCIGVTDLPDCHYVGTRYCSDEDAKYRIPCKKPLENIRFSNPAVVSSHGGVGSMYLYYGTMCGDNRPGNAPVSVPGCPILKIPSNAPIYDNSLCYGLINCQGNRAGQHMIPWLGPPDQSVCGWSDYFGGGIAFNGLPANITENNPEACPNNPTEENCPRTIPLTLLSSLYEAKYAQPQCIKNVGHVSDQGGDIEIEERRDTDWSDLSRQTIYLERVKDSPYYRWEDYLLAENNISNQPYIDLKSAAGYRLNNSGSLVEPELIAVITSASGKGGQIAFQTWKYSKSTDNIVNSITNEMSDGEDSSDRCVFFNRISEHGYGVMYPFIDDPIWSEETNYNYPVFLPGSGYAIGDKITFRCWKALQGSSDRLHIDKNQTVSSDSPDNLWYQECVEKEIATATITEVNSYGGIVWYEFDGPVAVGDCPCPNVNTFPGACYTYLEGCSCPPSDNCYPDEHPDDIWNCGYSPLCNSTFTPVSNDKTCTFYPGSDMEPPFPGWKGPGGGFIDDGFCWYEGLGWNPDGDATLRPGAQRTNSACSSGVTAPVPPQIIGRSDGYYYFIEGKNAQYKIEWMPNWQCIIDSWVTSNYNAQIEFLKIPGCNPLYVWNENIGWFQPRFKNMQDYGLPPGRKNYTGVGWDTLFVKYGGGSGVIEDITSCPDRTNDDYLRVYGFYQQREYNCDLKYRGQFILRSQSHRFVTGPQGGFTESCDPAIYNIELEFLRKEAKIDITIGAPLLQDYLIPENLPTPINGEVKYNYADRKIPGQSDLTYDNPSIQYFDVPRVPFPDPRENLYDLNINRFRNENDREYNVDMPGSPIDGETRIRTHYLNKCGYPWENCWENNSYKDPSSNDTLPDAEGNVLRFILNPVPTSNSENSNGTKIALIHYYQASTSPSGNPDGVAGGGQTPISGSIRLSSASTNLFEVRIENVAASGYKWEPSLYIKPNISFYNNSGTLIPSFTGSISSNGIDGIKKEDFTVYINSKPLSDTPNIPVATGCNPMCMMENYSALAVVDTIEKCEECNNENLIYDGGEINVKALFPTSVGDLPTFNNGENALQSMMEYKYKYTARLPFPTDYDPVYGFGSYCTFYYWPMPNPGDNFDGDGNPLYYAQLPPNDNSRHGLLIRAYGDNNVYASEVQMKVDEYVQEYNIFDINKPGSTLFAPNHKYAPNYVHKLPLDNNLNLLYNKIFEIPGIKAIEISTTCQVALAYNNQLFMNRFGDRQYVSFVVYDPIYDSRSRCYVTDYEAGKIATSGISILNPGANYAFEVEERVPPSSLIQPISGAVIDVTLDPRSLIRRNESWGINPDIQIINGGSGFLPLGQTGQYYSILFNDSDARRGGVVNKEIAECYIAETGVGGSISKIEVIGSGRYYKYIGTGLHRAYPVNVIVNNYWDDPKSDNVSFIGKGAKLIPVIGVDPNQPDKYGKILRIDVDSGGHDYMKNQKRWFIKTTISPHGTPANSYSVALDNPIIDHLVDPCRVYMGSNGSINFGLIDNPLGLEGYGPFDNDASYPAPGTLPYNIEVRSNYDTDPCNLYGDPDLPFDSVRPTKWFNSWPGDKLANGGYSVRDSIRLSQTVIKNRWNRYTYDSRKQNIKWTDRVLSWETVSTTGSCPNELMNRTYEMFVFEPVRVTEANCGSDCGDIVGSIPSAGLRSSPITAIQAGYFGVDHECRVPSRGASIRLNFQYSSKGCNRFTAFNAHKSKMVADRYGVYMGKETIPYAAGCNESRSFDIDDGIVPDNETHNIGAGPPFNRTTFYEWPGFDHPSDTCRNAEYSIIEDSVWVPHKWLGTQAVIPGKIGLNSISPYTFVSYNGGKMPVAFAGNEYVDNGGEKIGAYVQQFYHIIYSFNGEPIKMVVTPGNYAGSSSVGPDCFRTFGNALPPPSSSVVKCPDGEIYDSIYGCVEDCSKINGIMISGKCVGPQGTAFSYELNKYINIDNYLNILLSERPEYSGAYYGKEYIVGYGLLQPCFSGQIRIDGICVCPSGTFLLNPVSGCVPSGSV